MDACRLYPRGNCLSHVLLQTQGNVHVTHCNDQSTGVSLTSEQKIHMVAESSA